MQLKYALSGTISFENEAFIFQILDSAQGIHERGRRGSDRMVVGFTTTCAISAYHH